MEVRKENKKSAHRMCMNKSTKTQKHKCIKARFEL
jgi:hypothetical protein